jgi:hypothetical protein
MQIPTVTSIEHETRIDRLLRCVSSGYLSDGCSCEATVPARVAGAAWARELERAPAREDQFFRFLWKGGEWRAYGLCDGRVREHSARRGERSSERGGRVRVAVAS